eukprot:Gb_20328 [translate_table: standard]
MEEEKLGRRIMIAVDESEESMYALQWALDYLLIPGNTNGKSMASDQIIVVHAENEIALTGQVAFTPHVLDILERRQKLNTERVLSRAKTISGERNVSIETKMILGDARYAICEATEKMRIDLLVVGSHGHGALRRAVIGSVSDYCTHHAKCPVLIVKRQDR